MFLLDCCWLSGVKFTSSVSWMAIDSQTEVLALKIYVGYIPLLLFRKWSKTGTEAMLSRTLISSSRFSEAIRALNSYWLSDSIMNGDWLYFSHVKNAIRKPDWTYRFFQRCKYSAYKLILHGRIQFKTILLFLNLCTQFPNTTKQFLQILENILNNPQLPFPP